MKRGAEGTSGYLSACLFLRCLFFVCVCLLIIIDRAAAGVSRSLSSAVGGGREKPTAKTTP